MSEPFAKGFSQEQPVEFRQLLAEVLFEAERKGLGTVGVSFTVHPGMNDQAADFVGARCDHLAPKRL